MSGAASEPGLFLGLLYFFVRAAMLLFHAANLSALGD